MRDNIELPASWLKTPLADVANINPKTFCVLPSATNAPVHFVPMSAVIEDFGGIDVTTLRPLREVQKGYTSFLHDDVLFAKITPCMENGKIAIVPYLEHQLAFGSTEFHVMRTEFGIRPKWLAYYISQQTFRRLARQHMTGSAGQLRVATSWLSQAEIPLAPTAEQSRVISKLEELLSELDAGVAELKAAQKKLHLYRQSLLKAAVEGSLTTEWRSRNIPQETGAELLARILKERRARWEEKQLAKFKEQGKTPPKGWQNKYPEPVAPDTSDLPELPQGWVWASVDQLLEGIESGKSFKCDERPPKDHEVGVVKVSAVTWGEYNEQESKTCHDESMIRPELFVRAGDFLFSRANTIELVGACVIAGTTSKRIMLSDKILRLVLIDDQLKGWLLTLLRSKFGRKHIEALASGNQESMRNIGQERLRQIPVPIPSMHEISHATELLFENVSVAKQQEEAIQLSIKQSTVQRQNILRAAFAGELVPQDPSDEPASVLLERIRAERAGHGKAVKKPRGRKAKTMACHVPANPPLETL